MTPPLFQRAPRVFPTFPGIEVEIHAPPSIPARPTSSLVTSLLPFGFTLIGLGLSIFFLTGNNSSYLLLSLPLMFGSALVGVITYVNERKKYRQSLADRQRLYRDHLQERRQALGELANQQRRAAWAIHPDPRTCLAIARRQSPDLARHLWERSGGLERPRDPDFLELRLGLGALPPLFSVKTPPRPAQVGEKDELYELGLRLAADFQQVDQIPITLPLAAIGAAGLAGPRPLVLESVRAALVQLTALHAPNEVKLVALLPQCEWLEWEWLRWLPHIWDEEHKRRYLSVTPAESRGLLAEFFPLLQKRALAQGASDQPRIEHPAYLFLFADPALYAAGAETSAIGPLMRLVLTQGRAANAFALFLNDRPEALPAACGAVLDLNGSARLRLVGPPTRDLLILPDRISAAEADQFARALAPIRLQALTSAADLPASLPLTALLQTSQLESYPLESLWNARDSHQSLEVPLGMEAGGGLVAINFQDTASRGDGSHAMIGGTTGTGKTRFLQTLILLLATHHHPHDLNFILIDYKGQDLLKGLEDLPHVVGTLGNLEKTEEQAVMIERLFVCLEAELRRRRNLLAGRNINQYQRDHLQSKDPQPLPHLFVVIDEFAEMLRNSPDSSSLTRRLLSIGATGRSLGVHLVLATQDPSGVVNDELRNNINIRICLRMGSREASTSILRRSDAFDNIASAQVGRAYLQVGNDDRFVLFQVAWGGDPYQPGQSSIASGLIFRVERNGTRAPLRSYIPLAPGSEPDIQLTALVRHIQQSAAALGIQRLPSPLSPPLRSEIYLEELLPTGLNPLWDAAATSLPWLSPIIGQLDDPAAQAQPPLALPLGDSGHLALFGESGSGKTNFLQALVTSLALTYPPNRVHIYLVESTGRRMELLKGFPHVGDHFSSDDLERLRRFFRFLEGELRQRKDTFARLGVSSLRGLHTQHADAPPAIVTLLEDYAAFYALSQDRAPDLNDRLVSLVREGAAYGLHFVLTLAAPTELRVNLANNISLAAALRLANPADYSLAVGPAGLQPAPMPGRGLFKGTPPLEFQTAMPVRGRNDPERLQMLKTLMESLARAWGDRPRPRAFAPIPAVLPLSQVTPLRDAWPDPPPKGFSAAFALSLEDPDQAFRVDLRQGPYFLVTGAPQSGKSTLLQAWLLALAEKYPPSRLLLYLVDYRRTTLFPLSDLPHVSASLQLSQEHKSPSRVGYLADESSLSQALTEIEAEMNRRQVALAQARQQARAAFNLHAWLDFYPTILLALDDFDLFENETQSSAKEILNQNLKKWRDLGFALIAVGPLAEMENAWGWIKFLRDNPIGFQMGTAAYNQVFKNNNLPADNPSKQLPPGQGFYIARGQFHPIQSADPNAAPLPLSQWVEKILARLG